TTGDYTLIKGKSKLLHVDISPDIIGKVYKPSLPVASDVNEFLTALTNEVIVEQNVDRQDILQEDDKQCVELATPKQSHDQVEGNADRNNILQEANKQYVEFATPKEANDKREGYADLKKVIQDLKKNRPDDAIITSDAGNFFSWISRYYQYGENEIYLGPTSGAMGYGMPSAIGAKVAAPGKTVVSISGDGGFMMTMQEFETAVRYNEPIISLVINNNKYGTIRAHQENKFPDRVIGTNLTNPDFASLA